MKGLAECYSGTSCIRRDSTIAQTHCSHGGPLNLQVGIRLINFLLFFSSQHMPSFIHNILPKIESSSEAGSQPYHRLVSFLQPEAQRCRFVVGDDRMSAPWSNNSRTTRRILSMRRGAAAYFRSCWRPRRRLHGQTAAILSRRILPVRRGSAAFPCRCWRPRCPLSGRPTAAQPLVHTARRGAEAFPCICWQPRRWPAPRWTRSRVTAS